MRSRRVGSAMTAWWLNAGPRAMARRLHALGMLDEQQVRLSVPANVEAERRDGWCLVMRGGAVFQGLSMPLNMRDEQGAVLGELVALEARGDDLWGLVVFRHPAESDEAFALRVRAAVLVRPS